MKVSRDLLIRRVFGLVLGMGDISGLADTLGFDETHTEADVARALVELGTEVGLSSIALHRAVWKPIHEEESA